MMVNENNFLKISMVVLSILGYEKSGDNIRVIDLNRNECFS